MTAPSPMRATAPTPCLGTAARVGLLHVSSQTDGVAQAAPSFLPPRAQREVGAGYCAEWQARYVLANYRRGERGCGTMALAGKIGVSRECVQRILGVRG